MATGAEPGSVYHPPEWANSPELSGGIYYDEHGFPDFSPYSEVNVTIEMTGINDIDKAAANAAVGLSDVPDGFVWHHHYDGQTMMLVPRDVNDIPHTGGAAIAREIRRSQ
jgi:filamentous hemagglutinin